MHFNRTTLGLIALGLATAVGTAAAVRTAPVVNPLVVGLSTQADINTGFNGRVNFKLTNNSRNDVRMARWQTPIGGLEHEMFEVTRDGVALEYLGKHVKRSGIQADEVLSLRAGQSKVVSVDLSQSYDLSQPGTYSVRYKAYLQGATTADGRRIQSKNGGLAVAQSATLQTHKSSVTATPDLLQMATKARKPPSGNTCSGSTCFVGCSSTQQSAIVTAVSNAKAYALNSSGYLNAGTAGPRYSTWFGAYTSTRYNKASNNFNAIYNAFNTKQITVNCGCSQSAYAYVYPNQPYQIWVCRAFWTASATGTDSKAGTLVHEMSHFDVVANTDDVVYGQSGAKSLAISNPDDALRNADSHEYFAENTPFQN